MPSAPAPAGTASRAASCRRSGTGSVFRACLRRRTIAHYGHRPNPNSMPLPRRRRAACGDQFVTDRSIRVCAWKASLKVKPLRQALDRLRFLLSIRHLQNLDMAVVTTDGNLFAVGREGERVQTADERTDVRPVSAFSTSSSLGPER